MRPTNDSNSKYVYVCEYGVVHECGPGSCQLATLSSHGEHVCPVSGMVIDVVEDVTFGKNPEMQHWVVIDPNNNTKYGTKRPRTEKSLTEKISLKVSEILGKLFCGTERRRAVHNKRTRWLRRCEQQQSKYLQTQKGQHQCYNMQEFLRIKSNLAQKYFTNYTIFAGDDSVPLARIQSSVEQVWAKAIEPFYGELNLHKTVQDAPTRPNLTYTTLAILFYMKTGYSNTEGHTIIPRDAFVAEHLPLEQDIENFGYILSLIKPAKDRLLRFFECAQKSYINIVYEATDVAASSPVFVDDNLVFKPTTRGLYCERCKKRHDNENYECIFY